MLHRGLCYRADPFEPVATLHAATDILPVDDVDLGGSHHGDRVGA